MNAAELIGIINEGENSYVEFKRDDEQANSLAKEMSALLNLEGGLILLGVEDDGSVSGLVRSRGEVELWVMNIVRHNLQPGFIPQWSSVTLEGGKVVGIIRLPQDIFGKPYKARHGSAWTTYVRVGRTSRAATREEEGRLYQFAGVVRYEIKPVVGTDFKDLDFNLLDNYSRKILKRKEVPELEDAESWRQLLLNVDLLARSDETVCTTVASLLLFGRNPNRRIPQAGVTATTFPGNEKDYDTTDEEIIRGPLVSEFSGSGRVLEKGVIDRAVDFVLRNMGTTAWLEGGRRLRKKAFPDDAIRESIVNAVAHRDYTVVGTDIELSLYSDRIEVISPGRLPNGVTVDKMKDGLRAARNEMLKEILRDYGYVEHLGMGVRNRIIRSMITHNGKVPDLIGEGERFIVRLWK